jgi:hypothetical protein
MDIGESALLTDLAMCINYYRLFSPGLYCCVHAPLQLTPQEFVRPGLVVMVNHGIHKQCHPGTDYDCFHGPPNFILDVFSNSESPEYQRRRKMFERAQVLEYVAVFCTEPVLWHWNRYHEGGYILVDTAAPDLIVSSALPGLWIPAEALAQRDWWAVMAATARGVSRVGHHHFMDTIWKPDQALPSQP